MLQTHSTKPIITHSFPHSLLKPNNSIFSPCLLLTFHHKPPPNSNQHWLSLTHATQQEDGPIEISPDMPSIFATNDNPTPLQISTSVLLTGSITVFLFRALRRRAKRAKELRMRSSGAKKTMKEEALENLKAMGSVSIEPKGPPSPVQALLGGITAGVIALILYKFTTTIEAALNRQTISDNFSVRQITITVRTIINGLCYLATFVFGINSVGLLLYSGQLALNSMFDDSTANEAKPEDGNEASSLNISSSSSSTTETTDSDQTS